MIKLSAFLLPWLAAAQLSPNSVTVSATRVATPAVEQAAMRIVVSAPVDASREEVLATGAGAGLTAANFASVSYYPASGDSSVSWEFAVSVPVNVLKAKIAALTAMQNALAKEARFSLAFVILGSDELAAAAQDPACSLSDLLSDARAQASKLASAAGASLGAIQAILGGTALIPTTPSGIGSGGALSAPICTVTVKFALGGL